MDAVGIDLCGPGRPNHQLFAVRGRNSSGQGVRRLQTAPAAQYPAPTSRSAEGGLWLEESWEGGGCGEGVALVVDVRWTDWNLDVLDSCVCHCRPQWHLSSSCHTVGNGRSTAQGWWVVVNNVLHVWRSLLDLLWTVGCSNFLIEWQTLREHCWCHWYTVICV